jgi:hypothetical protein
MSTTGAGGNAVGAVLAQLRPLVDELMGVDLGDVDGASGPAVHAELARLVGQVQTVAGRVLARVEADGRWQAGGARSFGEWVARREGSSVGAARRAATLGRALDEQLPATRVAVARGEVTVEHAQLLAAAATSSPQRAAALASEDSRVNEAALLERARLEGADRFKRTVAAWAASVDGAAAEKEHQAAAAKEHFTLTPRADGVAFQGFLTHEHGEVLFTALRAVAGVPAAEDPRSREQRQAAALVDAARLILDRGLVGSGQGVRPHISVHVSWDAFLGQVRSALAADLAAGASTDWLPAEWTGEGAGPGQAARAGEGAGPGQAVRVGEGAEAESTRDRAWARSITVVPPAELDSRTPLPRSILDRLACDSEISRIVFGPESEVLDLGRSQRTYTGQHRRAVIARDRECQYPGCSAPPNLSEVHHIRWWARDHGETSVEGGVLLCWHHHELVHQRNLSITRAGGTWAFARPDGRPVEGRPSGGGPPGPHPDGGPPGPHPDGGPPGPSPDGSGRMDAVQAELALAG